ncbi:MAG: permease [Alphaproteobacteria bacterium]|nr:permease [Alphaproteobacteria bacterium]
MLLLPRYLLKTTMITTVLISIVLTLIIWLTQTLRLLDFVINGGAPMSLFSAMLFLTIPRFFEVILPLSLALGILYSLNKFSADSELVVMQNSGLSPLRLSQGILLFSAGVAVFILVLAGWLTPLANRKLDALRSVVRSEYSMGLLRPGIFNAVSDDTTVYIAQRTNLKDLRGVFIHFNKRGEVPTTITAERGGLVMQNGKPIVIVLDGTRQQFNPKTGAVETLKFEQYNLDLSSLTKSIESLQLDPNDRTVSELWSAPQSPRDDIESRRLSAEFHTRLARPFLTLAFALISTVPFLIGRFNRRGQNVRIGIIVGILLGIQGIHLASSSLASNSVLGLVLLYAVPWLLIIGYLAFLISQNQYRMLLPFTRRSVL